MFHKKDDKPKEPITQENTETEATKDEVPKTDSPHDKLVELEKQKEEYLNGWKRERADFLNYKKEEMERMTALIKYANEELVLKMLPILDNFLLAEKNIPEELKKDNNIKGLLLINLQLKDFLKAQGIEEIKAVGEKFNPNFHEVVQETPEEGKESGIITEEVQRGYLMEGKVLRPAKVKVIK